MVRRDTVLPKPSDLWSKSHQHALLALFFVFSLAWALEQCVTLVLENATLLTVLVSVKGSPTLKVRVFVPICPFCTRQIRFNEPQNWRFGSSFSIKARRSVTGSRVGNTEFGPSVRLSPLYVLIITIERFSRLRLHCYHLWNATHYSARTS